MKNIINNLVIELVNEYLNTQEIEKFVNNELVLFGEKSIIDSMGLVNIIIDIETRLAEEGINITLTSENAMSRSSSPFRTVVTLTNYILELIGEADE